MEYPYFTESEIIKLLQQHNLYTIRVKKALSRAKKSHIHQKRTNGTPYLEEHIYPIIKEIIEDFLHHDQIEEIIITAFLHDVVEDDNSVSLIDINEEFGADIMHNVDTLTKKPEENSKALSQDQKYEINKKMVQRVEEGNEIVKVVKLEDRYNNVLCLEPIKGTAKFDRYVKETQEIFLPFAKKNSPLLYKKIRKALSPFI